MSSKFAGPIGFFSEQVEISPGSFDDVIVERNYYGDVSRPGIRTRMGENILPDLDITNEFNIMANAFAFENFDAMRYIEWRGVRWTIRQVEVQAPRLILRVGGVYNGPTP